MLLNSDVLRRWSGNVDGSFPRCSELFMKVVSPRFSSPLKLHHQAAKGRRAAFLHVDILASIRTCFQDDYPLFGYITPAAAAC